MPRNPRKLSATGVYHIMLRGIDKMQLFRDDPDCVQFLCYLNFVQSTAFQILAYCLMGNHVHLLVKTPKTDTAALESAMRSVASRYATYYNHKYDRIGSVFQGRFASQAVTSEGYFFRVLRYIHRNPQEAGMVEDLSEYRWSSYTDYFLTRTPCICEVETKYALELHSQEWLLQWHRFRDQNTIGFLEVRDGKPRMYDSDVIRVIDQIADCTPMQLHLLPLGKQKAVCQALCEEEGVRVCQLSRLTGIPKGVIRRYLV